MAVPKQVLQLIETFDRNIDAYKKQQYNETQVRLEFINPFFEALGWDVTNKSGNAEAYKDVIHEDAIKIGGHTKAPDYCFRIGGTRKFFLEAKKPSIDVKGDPNPAYQLRRYAWSSTLPLSILTDFEEFAVYDCQTRPKQADKAATARIIYLKYKDYIDHWDEIADIFSKDAILKGSFDKFAVSTKAKRGTTTVDKEFLVELEKWRAELARIIALRNRELSARDINFAVQRTIDRIIFLRMCEDRSIETYGQLQAISSGSRTYPRLCEVFEKADHKYNSGLFYFQKEPGRPEGPDELTPNLVVDDSPLKYMLYSLYYPQCPYEFSVLPPEILGNVYEQFLGSVIQVSLGRRTKVEPKPEVKKAGGIYYTPNYIVDYIVKNTVGKLCEGKEPKQIQKLCILDPACGSGSFLLSAYTYLLNHHRDWYVENSPEKHTKKIYQGMGGQWYLTIAEKKKILLNNIFGVDIDSQAVEVTKLSLLLKVLEGETSETIGQTYKMFHERALPDLGNNIKCGNSLIGPDFYDDKTPDSFDEEQIRKINAFDWKTEFPHIFKAKNLGFNAVIGNPPYVSIKGIPWDDRRYYEKKYSVKGRFDLYIIFILKALANTTENGYWSFVIPNKFATNLQFSDVRNLVAKSCIINSIVSYEGYQFKTAGVNSIVISCNKAIPRHNDSINLKKWENATLVTIGQQKQSTILSLPETNFVYLRDSKKQVLIGKIGTTGKPYHFFFDVKDGIVAGGIKDVLFSNKRIDDSSYKLYFGKGIGRYSLEWTGIWVNYKPAVMMQLEIRRKDSKRPGLWMRDRRIFDKSKILTRKVGTHIIATLDVEGVYYEQTLHGSLPRKFDGPYNIRYFLGILNSTLVKFYYQTFVQQKGKLFPQVRIGILKLLPIRALDFDNPDDKAMHSKMVKLVERMLDLHKRLSAAKVPTDKTRIQRQINTTDKQIDKLVYDLYGLTEEEIAIVEQSS